MSENLKEEDLIEKNTAVSTSETANQETGDTKVNTTEVKSVEQDPLKTELDKVRNKEGRSEKEKAEFSLKKNAERVKLLGGDPLSLLGVSGDKIEDFDENDEDDKPVTVGMLKKIQQQNAEKTALQLAEEISNESERELVKYHLQNSIKSSGNPTEDIKLARAIVNSVKNSQILEESARKTSAKTHSNSSGAPAKTEQVVGELSEEELLFTKPPFNLTPKQVVALRENK